MPLSAEQDLVVNHSGSPLRVLAGPGTGKTHTLAHRVKHLIQVQKIPPSKVYALTFSIAAARDMRGKLLSEGLKSDMLPHVSTLHSLAVSLIKEYGITLGLPMPFRILDSKKLSERVVLKDVSTELQSLGIKVGFQTKDKIYSYLEAFRAECGGKSLPEWITTSPTKNDWYAQFKVKYQDMLRFYSSLDWFMVVQLSVRLLTDNQAARDSVHDRIAYLLVDEYQDLNPSEQKFVDLLLNDVDHLCLIGDDDQSIYESFRYADPSGIINLPKRYASLTSRSLSQCRRCPKQVIEKALKVISQNVNREHNKSLVAYDPARKGYVGVFRHSSAKKESLWLVERVRKSLNAGVPPEEIMVLFSESGLASDYIAAFKAAKIPIAVQLTTRSVFDSECFSQVYETLRFLVNEEDNLALRQCLDYWSNIGDKTVRQIRSLALSNGSSLWQAAFLVKQFSEAHKQILHRKSVASFCEYILELRKEISPQKVVDRVTSVLDNCGVDQGIAHLKSVFAELSGDQNLVSLQELVEQFEERRKAGDFDDPDEIGVRIMTMHSSKGLEALIVLIPALENDIFPGQSSHLEEKRRLFYVSMTRAKRDLYLSWSSQRTGIVVHKAPGRTIVHGKCASRFILEMGGTKT